MVNGKSEADFKFDLSKTSVIILLSDLIIHKLAYLKYLYIETKELRMVMVDGEDMDIKCGEKMGKRKGFGRPVNGT